MLKTVRSAHSCSQMRGLHPAWIEVDLEAFKDNIQCIRDFLGETRYCLPVKANAYGHGLQAIGKAAEQAGVDYLAVSNVYEGIQLREWGIGIPILVLGAFQREQIEFFVDYDLEFTISSLYKAQLVEEKLQALNQKARVHLEVDTGMNRTGSRPETSKQVYQAIQQSSHLHLVGIYSHLVSSENKEQKINQVQERRFEKFVSCCDPRLIFHFANSGGVVNQSNIRYGMVRPGLLSYGIYSSSLPKALQNLKSCFTLKSRVSYFKVVHKDEGISYGPIHKTSKQTRVVTISIGYGDGYKRALSNIGKVLIRGHQYPIIGSICMDQLMVDIGEKEAYVGDEVVLIGKQGPEVITVEDVAKQLNTIPYEVLCSFTQRIPIFYT